ncbi:alpha/beta hydrolase [Aquibium sp. A9E412]|uniref:alpha/beta hydrolase n=1 Tax=Aquibium sp. A9E412 TaxID=2976767 RepID=UPI0025B1F0AA|nr:alpha/beta hydrolase [Aquibium sp. A9E412]MDN2564851.1 alpha/beta hydrolase [Aquibium sp. A9E412]
MHWTELSADELEYQFNPQHSVADFQSFQVHRSAVSRVCRETMTAHLDVAYGPGALHKVDIFPAGEGAPVHMFFHGGYWRTQDKANFAFIARDLVPRGITLVVVNYDLCPAVTLDAVSASAREAVAWCHGHIAAYGGDPQRISLSGNSAGAHLCSIALATDWRARGLPGDLVKGTVMISGIFDPAPARLISVNAELSLSEETVRANDTERLPPQTEALNYVFAGGREPWAWVDQSFRYSAHLRRHGQDPEVHVLPGYHHFNIMDQYLEPASPIARAVQAVCAL